MIWNGQIREICLWTISIHDEFHGTAFQIFLEELPAAWQSKQHGSQVPVLCAWAMGCPGWLHIIPDTPPPRQWTATWKTNQTTTTTTHRYVWVSWYILYMIFKGAKSLALFLQRGFGGCYGLNHMPWIFSKVTDYGDSQQGWLKLFGPRLEAVKLNMMSKWWRTTKSPKRTGGKDLHLHIFFGCEHKTHSKTKPSKIMMRDILFKEVWGYLSV